MQYIHLSADELASMAQHIRSKGRVSISNLSVTASKLLDLEGKQSAASASMAEYSLDDLVEE